MIEPLPDLLIAPIVRAALAEDLGRAGDVTSIATIPPGTASRTVLAARKAGTIAGLPLAAAWVWPVRSSSLT